MSKYLVKLTSAPIINDDQIGTNPAPGEKISSKTSIVSDIINTHCKCHYVFRNEPDSWWTV